MAVARAPDWFGHLPVVTPGDRDRCRGHPVAYLRRPKRSLQADVYTDSLARVGAARGAGDMDERPSLQMLIRRSWDRPTQRDWSEVLGALPLFSRLPKRHVRAIAKLAWRVDRAPGEVIVQAGDRGNSLYLVLEGRARVVGKSRVLRPGDFFGEMALIDGGPRSATIIAASQVRLMMLQRQTFLKALEHNPQIGLAIMETLSERVRRLERAVSA
jgi:CRP/FNR family transcriptional regulator, cyclic AMP receptor protein